MAVRETLFDPIVSRNPVTLQVLGICSALAITNSLNTALVMGVSLTAVLVFSNASISLIRNFIPSSLRIIIQVTIIATGVIVVDQVLQAFAPEVARTLSVFISLIVTNCIVLGRAEAFAVKNTVGMSVLDGIGNGLGYTLVLAVVAFVREFFGAGSLLGFPMLPTLADGGWYLPNQLMLLPPSAFFIIGFLIWAIRAWKRDQVETREFEEVETREIPDERPGDIVAARTSA
ncbi:MAG: NADH:ubiquinone reductase (Na(+)-transporting) subunit D [Gammaproteobacteria bacterium]|nr:MAG: NADH:ubiquinone reductase (Na(+)-transporting) subunit D [Gammaproteobacteria bacterium]